MLSNKFVTHINVGNAAPVDAWVPLINKRIVTKKNDTISARLTPTKAGNCITLTLSIGSEIADLLKWKAGMTLSPEVNLAKPLLLRLRNKQDASSGYSIYSGGKLSSRIYLKISIRLLPHAIFGDTRDVQFSLAVNDVVIDLSSLSSMGTPHPR